MPGPYARNTLFSLSARCRHHALAAFYTSLSFSTNFALLIDVAVQRMELSFLPPFFFLSHNKQPLFPPCLQLLECGQSVAICLSGCLLRWKLFLTLFPSFLTDAASFTPFTFWACPQKLAASFSLPLLLFRSVWLNHRPPARSRIITMWFGLFRFPPSVHLPICSSKPRTI